MPKTLIPLIKNTYHAYLSLYNWTKCIFIIYLFCVNSFLITHPFNTINYTKWFFFFFAMSNIKRDFVCTYHHIGIDLYHCTHTTRHPSKQFYIYLQTYYMCLGFGFIHITKKKINNVQDKKTNGWKNKPTNLILSNI